MNPFYNPAILCVYCILHQGNENTFGYRLNLAWKRIRNNRIAIAVSALAYMAVGAFIYYNTLVLNDYASAEEMEDIVAKYEKSFKKYENLAQPRFRSLDFSIDLRPEDRSFKAKITSWAINRSGTPIRELHFTMPLVPDSVKITIPNAKLILDSDELYYRIYALDKPLAANDSVMINVEVSKATQGFENSVSFTEVTQNGSFFNNTDLMPTLGYNSNFEMSDKKMREKHKLPKREIIAKLDNKNVKARMNSYLSNDSDWVQVNTVISTSGDQTAIAPGSLVRSWKKRGRNYFNYKLDHQSVNFYSFTSAKFEVARTKWKGIDLEVYFDKKHAYNVANMLNSMKKSLEYYTTHFGPYPHKQARIIEFPRYSSFAQAFPGTIPFSEGIGFILDLSDPTAHDIDQVFYVVAHEMAHQYWAHQVVGANMQGSELLSEGFAQYSALMVMEKEYGKDKMKKFLEYEMDRYLGGRSQETDEEQPLMKTQGQQYIHYNKASVVMYYLKEMIGQEKVDEALKNLLLRYGYKNAPYPTSIDAVNEFRNVTPPELQYVITDMFENITVFSNKVEKTSYKKVGSVYEVTFTTVSEKFRADGLGNETAIPINNYIDIAVFAEPENGNTLGKVLAYKRIKVTKKGNTYTLFTSEKPYSSGIDPYNYLIDRRPDDNIRLQD
ncbi:M1 family aminopeptidase [Flavobacterium cerinum]|uniref:Peptidase M1 membrane alanine aminopeptidase domain-containing protein n=1 Tax=Flavobacterium cerinum TaxID=2502784 RepID=A0A3S3QNV6_9FLAO|nr:M1 family aminopeptidase [Flavobacterium cerinum]RWW96725.1 hypothetical protein EPI11_14115 [Flavobacterium cerinum]